MQVTKEEFRNSLPLLGFDTSQSEVIDQIFEELDEDGSGTLDYDELSAKLRQGLCAEIADVLQGQILLTGLVRT